MRLTLCKFWTVTGILAFVLAGVTAQAALSKQHVDAIVQSIKQTPILELSAKAAFILADTTSTEREQAVAEIVKAVAAKKRTSLALVVAALCKAYPELAAKVASTAVEYVPELAEDIVFAAVKAAPNQIQQITTQVSTVQFASSTKAASEALAARVRSAARSASQTAPNSISTQTAGMLNDPNKTGTATKNTTTTVFGADPSRYGAP